MAGQGLLSGLWRGGLPRLCGKAGGSRGKRFGEPVSCHRRPVAPREERNAAALRRIPVQQPEGVVAGQAGPCVAGVSGRPHPARQRVPLLFRENRPPRLQRSSDVGPGGGRSVAPHPQRDPHSGSGDGWEPQNGVVGVSQRAYLESHRLFQSGAAEMRLSRLCRQSPPGAAGTLPTGTGGDGIKTGPVSQFPAQK